MSEPRTITLPTADHGDVTLPEPSWCIGHESTPGDRRADILHQGADVELVFHGHVFDTTGLVEAPFAELPGGGLGASVGLLGQTLDPVGLYELAAAFDTYADRIRGLADQLDTLRSGGVQ
ncbi:hypothetical protein OHB41_34100 [Streptomyces sp. NBC_01571]|uniref:DUF6907 domain-containing protein n=1 Tax=Streptomyces sp. NBC_01571 TaxID=2975883 RepID=UPI002258E4BA|nr:hypothetical protein [Streptomyces sp. NBC_01571]MCX4578136.1 hypothetical protein [Streptomyces sp. NBC_01571]